MLGDRERSGAYASEQRQLVRDAVAGEVLAFTPYWREAAAEAGLRSPSSVGDLLGLPPRPLGVLGPPDALVLRPSAEAVRKAGPKPLRRRLRRARFGRGSAGAMRRILDPLYKPVHWLIDGDVPVGCTEADLVRLAELGRRSLEAAGVTGDDAIVGLIPPGPSLSSWQLALGARAAGVPLAGLAPSASIGAISLLGPTVLAGRPADLLRVLQGLSGSVGRAIVTVLAISRSPLLGPELADLERAAGEQATVVEWWAPPGVRALWAQCRGGAGVHTWPQAELVEVCGRDGTPTAPDEEGELVWTGLGWRGTTLVRLATGTSGRVVDGACDTCGRTTPRVLDAALLPGSRGRAGRAEAEGAEEEEVPPPRRGNGTRDEGRPPRGRRARKPTARAGPAEEVAAGAASEPDRLVLGATDDGRVSLRAGRAGSRPEADPAPGPAAGDARGTDAAWAAPVSDDAEGVVRAVAKDPAPAEAEPEPAPAPTRRPAPAELGHLPPVPAVGPDGDGGPDQGWLPETGEVDAWPAPVLASTAGLAAWQVEHRRRRGHDELVVHLALAEDGELADVLVALERSVGATQYVVSAEAEIDARIAAADGRRIVDRRAPTNGHRR